MSDALIEASNNVMISTANILDRMMLLSSSNLVLPNNSLMKPLSSMLDQDIQAYNKVLDEMALEFVDAEHALQFLKQKISKEEELKQQRQLELQKQKEKQEQEMKRRKEQEELQKQQEAAQAAAMAAAQDKPDPVGLGALEEGEFADLANLDFGNLVDDVKEDPGKDPSDILSSMTPYKDENQDFLADYAMSDAYGAPASNTNHTDDLQGADEGMGLQDFNLGDLLTDQATDGVEQDLGLVPDGEMNHLFDEFDILLGNGQS